MRTTAKAAWYHSARVSLPDDSLALVLAGGKGSRLRAADDRELRETPKMLVRIERPEGLTAMLGHTLNELYQCGFPRIAVLTSADPLAGTDAVERYALSCQRVERPLNIYREPYPLGTAGAVYAALRDTAATVAAVVPADTLFPFAAIPAAVAAHVASGHAVTWTVTTQPGAAAQNAGMVLVEPGRARVAHALEGLPIEGPGPSAEGLEAATSTGVVIVTRTRYMTYFERYVERLDRPCPTDLYRRLIPWLLSQGVDVGAFDIREPAPDLGTPDRLHTFGRPSGPGGLGAIEPEMTP